jgi:hypothetical protein
MDPMRCFLKLGATQRESVPRACFDPEHGHGYTLCLHIVPNPRPRCPSCSPCPAPLGVSNCRRAIATLLS